MNSAAMGFSHSNLVGDGDKRTPWCGSGYLGTAGWWDGDAGKRWLSETATLGFADLGGAETLVSGR